MMRTKISSGSSNFKKLLIVTANLTVYAMYLVVAINAWVFKSSFKDAS